MWKKANQGRSVRHKLHGTEVRDVGNVYVQEDELSRYGQVPTDWRGKLRQQGYVYLDEEPASAISIADMSSRSTAWCFCDCVYFVSKYDKCPRCGILTKTIIE